MSHNIDINHLFEVMQKITEHLTKSGNIPPLRFAKYYLFEKELTMKEIGAVLEITESRVSQIHSKAALGSRWLQNTLKLSYVGFGIPQAPG